MSVAESILAHARLHALAGAYQEAADEAFRALLVADSLSTVQVQAQVLLSQVAELMDRPVEALSFALAARVSAIDGRLYPLESSASALFMRLIRRYGEAPVAELAGELERRGINLYHYVDLEGLEQSARSE